MDPDHMISEYFKVLFYSNISFSFETMSRANEIGANQWEVNTSNHGSIQIFFPVPSEFLELMIQMDIKCQMDASNKRFIQIFFSVSS